MQLEGVVAGARAELGLGPAYTPTAADVAPGGDLGGAYLRPDDPVTRQLVDLGAEYRTHGRALADIANGTSFVLDGTERGIRPATRAAAHEALVRTLVEGAYQGRSAMPRAPRTTGNDVQLLVQDREYLPSLYADLLAAEHSITITQYNFEDSGSGRAVLDIIRRVKAERPDLDVRIVIDSYGVAEPGAELGEQLVQDLRDAGAQVVISRSPLKPGGQGWEHRKIMLVDDRVAYLGGLGLADKYTPWMDTMTRVEGPAAAVASVNSLAMWGDLVGHVDWRMHERLQANQDVLLGRRALADLPPPTGPGRAGPEVADTAVTMLENRPGDDLAITEQFLRDARAAGAGDELWVTSSYLTTDIVADELEAAARRGADVKLAVSSLTAKNDEMQVRVGRGLYEELLDAGVEVYEWPVMLHGKTWMLRPADGETVVTTGSMNLSKMSLKGSRESNMRIEGDAYGERYAEWHRMLQNTDGDASAAGHRSQRITYEDLGTEWSDPIVSFLRWLAPDLEW